MVTQAMLVNQTRLSCLDESIQKIQGFMARVKDKKETFNTRLKVFRVLTSCHHCGTSLDNKLNIHQIYVEMIAVMVQYSMENGSPLFKISRE